MSELEPITQQPISTQLAEGIAKLAMGQKSSVLTDPTIWGETVGERSYWITTEDNNGEIQYSGQFKEGDIEEITYYAGGERRSAISVTVTNVRGIRETIRLAVDDKGEPAFKIALFDQGEGI